MFKKLKSLLLPQTLSLGFGLKFKNLLKKKWFFLRGLLYRRNKKFWFLDQGLETARSNRKKIKLSYFHRLQAFNSAKLFFHRLKKTEVQKRTAFLQRRVNKSRSIQLLNFFERRLVVLLLRSGFFDRLSHAVQAIRAGDVFVNGKCVRSPQHILSVHDFVHLTGSTKQKVRQVLSAKKSFSFKIKNSPLFPNQNTVTRKLLKLRCQNSKLFRLAACLSASKVVSELFFIEDSRRKDLKRYRHRKLSSWPVELNTPKVPSYLLVDYRFLSFYLKSSVYSLALSPFYRQNLSLFRFWRF